MEEQRHMEWMPPLDAFHFLDKRNKTNNYYNPQRTKLFNIIMYKVSLVGLLVELMDGEGKEWGKRKKCLATCIVLLAT